MNIPHLYMLVGVVLLGMGLYSLVMVFPSGPENTGFKCIRRRCLFVSGCGCRSDIRPAAGPGPPCHGADRYCRCGQRDRPGPCTDVPHPPSQRERAINR